MGGRLLLAGAALSVAVWMMPGGAALGQTGTAATAPSSAAEFQPPKRRRIVLMRHGDVKYFDAQGKPVSDPDSVTLTELGQQQADAAGRYLAGLGVKSFDRVVTSNLPRTIETAQRVLASGGITGQRIEIPALREIRAGAATRGVPSEQLPAILLAVTKPSVAPETKFLGGESIGDMQKRVYASIDTLLEDDSWDNALIVLHAVVNSAIVSRALTGEQSFMGRFESGAGCFHVLDAAKTWSDWIVRAYNVCARPDDYSGPRANTMEKLLIQSLKGRSSN